LKTLPQSNVARPQASLSSHLTPCHSKECLHETELLPKQQFIKYFCGALVPEFSYYKKMPGGRNSVIAESSCRQVFASTRGDIGEELAAQKNS